MTEKYLEVSGVGLGLRRGGRSTHCALEGVHLTGEDLHLTSVVVGILLGLPEGFLVTGCRLGKVGKLREQKGAVLRFRITIHAGRGVGGRMDGMGFPNQTLGVWRLA